MTHTTAISPAPTPAVFARKHPAPPATARPVTADRYDRHAWETAVLSSTLHRNTRCVAFVLAHHADATGYLPAGGPQHASRLAHLARITPKQARLAMQQLENWHYLVRPDIRDWPPTEMVRPVRLTVPPVPAYPTEATG
ncbi:hypothetical protein ACIQCF_33315 [Streptomyces sp. NPDC088353]|uniref:hypothetical protein n=1 Tax=Streptomyces sp. NPDC088353 TaxID=3365855 RepID=UPI0037FC9356